MGARITIFPSTPLTDRHGDVWTPNNDGTYHLDGSLGLTVSRACLARRFGPLRHGAHPGKRIPSIADSYRLIADHIDHHQLGDTEPAIRTRGDGTDIQVFPVDGHAIPVITRWARSLPTNEVTVEPGPASTLITARGHLSHDMPVTVTVVVLDAEHEALHATGDAHVVSLAQLERAAHTARAGR